MGLESGPGEAAILETDMEFEKWPKMTRLEKVPVTITEKIDGTNAQIAIEFDEDGQPIVRAGSRNRWITPESDNFGFAQAVAEAARFLYGLLPPGRHYGEWAGPGIQKNPLNLPEKRFFAFNHWLFDPEFVARIQEQVPWFDVVPVWWKGTFFNQFDETGTVETFRQVVSEGIRLNESRQFDGPPEGFIIQVDSEHYKWTQAGAKWAQQNTETTKCRS